MYVAENSRNLSTKTEYLPATTHHDLCHCQVLLAIPLFDCEPNHLASLTWYKTTPFPPTAGPWGALGVRVETEDMDLGICAACLYPTNYTPPPLPSISRRGQSTLEEVKSGELAWGSHPSFSWMGFEDNKPVAPGRMETKCAVTESGFMAPNFTDLPHRNEDW